VPEAFDPTHLTGPQLRAARAMVRLKLQEVADRAEVHVLTVQRAEYSEGRVVINGDSAARIVRALQKAGVEFLAPRGDKGPGIRFKG
jgi:hypothetical protein